MTWSDGMPALREVDGVDSRAGSARRPEPRDEDHEVGARVGLHHRADRSRRRAVCERVVPLPRRVRDTREMDRHRHRSGVVHGEAHDLGRVGSGAQPRGHRRPDASAFGRQQLFVERVADHLAQPALRVGLTLGGDEVHAERGTPQHELGIDVGVTRPHAEVQRCAGRAENSACERPGRLRRPRSTRGTSSSCATRRDDG